MSGEDYDMEHINDTDYLNNVESCNVTGQEIIESQGRGRCLLKILREKLLLILMITSVVVGIAMGTGMRALDRPLDERQQMYFSFPGELLMRMLKCMIIPLIVSSLISGVAGLETSASGRIGLTAIVYYLVTSFTAALLGILLVTTIQPGFRSRAKDAEALDENAYNNFVDSFLDLIRNLFPDNIIEASFRQTRTKQTPITVVNSTACTTSDSTECNYTHVVYDFDIRKEDGMNALGLIVYSLATGIVVGRLGDVGKPLLNISIAVSETTMMLISAILWYSPIGISFLIAGQIIAMEDVAAELVALGYYIITVLSGLTIHGLIVLPVVFFVIVRRNPIKFLMGASEALITSFGTSSSSATLPVTIKCMEVNNGIDQRVTRFILPIGATINMDGTALYEAVAAIYLAQSSGIHLNAYQIVTTSITATLAAVGCAGVPSAGLVTLILVVTAIGLPADDIGKIIVVDWFLDRFRAVINVEGDCIGAGVVSHLCRKQLQKRQQ